ncbi:MAG TPA: FAD-dependent monooxygenase, partial [Devosia sp.]|nr:FAD-dependent monooxygenase [Devosia sp.]
MSAAAPEHFDVAIVGGGPVGMTMALALVQSMRGMRVALVDRRPLSIPKDNRASAIAAGVRRVFDALGVWSGMEAQSQPITAMRITDSGSGDIARPLFLQFGGEVAPGEAFAHMVPNTASQAALLEAMGDLVTIIAPAEIADWSEGRLTLA